MVELDRESVDVFINEGWMCISSSRWMTERMTKRVTVDEYLVVVEVWLRECGCV